MKKLSDLSLTLVPFNTKFINNCTVLWLSPETYLTESECLEKYSWITTDEVDNKNKIFFSDLYGGGEVAGNGGSSRSGYDGDLQVKGIGVTPLLSRYKDRSHSDGCICTFQAINDAFWGRVLNRILPHGAVESHAILKVPLYIPNPAYPPKTLRGLLVRDAPVRLAHFDRALYYKPQDKVRKDLPKDYLRVKQNLIYLEDFLDIELSRSMKKASKNAGTLFINTIIKRLAKQYAFCRASLIKLTTSSSNVTINGALLDFNATSSAVPKLFRDHDAWNAQIKYLTQEWKAVIPSFQNINHMWAKYRCDEDTPLTETEIVEIYTGYYEECREFFTLCRLGFPEEIIDSLEKIKKKNLIRLYDRTLSTDPKMILSENKKVSTTSHVLIKLHTSKDVAIKFINKSIPHSAARIFYLEFIDIVYQITASIDSRDSLLRAMIISTERQLCVSKELDFHNFNEEYISTDKSVTDLMKHAEERAIHHLAQDDKDSVHVLTTPNDKLSYKWKDNKWSYRNNIYDEIPEESLVQIKNTYSKDVLSFLIG